MVWVGVFSFLQNQQWLLQRDFRSRQFMIPNRKSIHLLNQIEKKKKPLLESFLTDRLNDNIINEERKKEPEKKGGRGCRFGGFGGGLGRKVELLLRLATLRLPIRGNSLHRSCTSLEFAFFRFCCFASSLGSRLKNQGIPSPACVPGCSYFYQRLGIGGTKLEESRLQEKAFAL